MLQANSRQIQKTLLVGVCIVLALATGGSVLAVLLSGDDMIGPMIGTAIASAILGGIMIGASRLLDKPKLYPTAGFLILACFVELLLILAAIWELDDVIRPFFPGAAGAYWWEPFVISAVIVPLFAVPTAALIAMGQFAGCKLASRVGIVIAFAALCISLFGAWFNTNGYGSTDVWEAIIPSLIGFGLIIVFALIRLDYPSQRWWRWIGVAAAVAGFICIMFEAVSAGSSDGFIAATFACIAVFVAHANLIAIAPLRGHQRWLGVLTLAASGVTLVLFILVIVADLNESSIFGRVAVASGLAATFGSLAVMALAIANRPVRERKPAKDVTAIDLTCPRCQTQQSLAVGEACCVRCNLRIHIEVEEPICQQCGYSLNMLEADHCPECGSAVDLPTPTSERSEESDLVL